MKWGVLVFITLAYQMVSAQPVCAKGYIELRKGPGTKFPVSWKVAKYMPFLLSDKKSGWGKVQDLEGEVHWAKLSDLNRKDRCVVVKVNVATLRQEPSNRSALAELKTLDRYTPLKRLESDREWIQVQDESGRTAWIHENYVWKPVIVNSFSF
ncbi:MAG: SH3 domain-containing protein [Bdellovibrionales bacterium]